MNLSRLVNGLRDMAEEFGTNIYFEVDTSSNVIYFGLFTRNAQVTRCVSFDEFQLAEFDISDKLLEGLRHDIENYPTSQSEDTPNA